MTSKKKEMMAEAMKEIETVFDGKQINEMYSMFIEALKEFDEDKAVDSMIFMFDMLSPETFAVLGYFLDRVGNRYQEKMLEMNDSDKMRKAERISEIMDELIDEDYEEEP